MLGDERPCLRCIKRGLQDQCHDGVRKKAKYLHDAPVEALVPGFAGNYHVHQPTAPGASSGGANGMPASEHGNYYPPNQTTTFDPYAPAMNAPPEMAPPPLLENHISNDFPTHHSVQTPERFQSATSQQISPAHEMSGGVDSASTLGTINTTSFDSNLFDATDPALFNFNLSDLNFGNHYGALEFGMLGHMSSGAVDGPDADIMNSMGPTNNTTVSYDNAGGFLGSYGFNPTFSQWQNVPNAGSRQGSTADYWGSQGNGMDAYAIGEQAFTGHSPQSQDFSSVYNVSPEMQYVQPEHGDTQQLLRQSISHAQQQQRKQSSFPGNPAQDNPRKRRRDTSEIYTSVVAPYSYTQGFHALTAFLQRRLNSKKVLRIAKALATIRPSFISCNKNLTHEDLIFMEKGFQRTLCEYEEFINHYGTPTIICRRTGEIAAVSKEFSLVTGWREGVLLGKEPNLNVNVGSTGTSGTATGASTRGAATPRMPNLEADPGRPQPVFLAELLDEDSVVQFYEDFAELAFGASRTSIIGEPCSLLKYRTKEDPGWGPDDHLTDDGKRIKKSGIVKSDPLIRGEAGMNALGERDGRVECSFCWTTKRDMFDIPMLIVMNVSAQIICS